tara:strand:- start:34 stop:744 length:711 start_codon:yes stop_codon:yes gene_type:complete
MKFSVIIPCYNEQANLPLLIDRILPLQNDYELEYILVENGSTDNSREYFTKMIEGKYKNIIVKYLDINKGYGFGLKQGLKLAKGQFIGWIHADMQAHPNELRQIFDSALSNKSDQKIFLKARRINRPFVDKFFAFNQKIFSFIVFFYIMSDIGASPLIFSRALIDNFDEMPDDFSVEVFTFLKAKKKNFYIERFNIILHDRENSISSWNTGLISKFKLSLIIIKSSLLIKIKELKR